MSDAVPSLTGRIEGLHSDVLAEARETACRVLIRYRHPERPLRVPAQVQIEPTSRCNLRCRSCPHSRERQSGRGRHLSPDELATILDRLPFRVTSVILSGIGEPLLNPAFPALVDLLAHRGIDCRFYTNGTLLTDTMRTALLARPNISRIAISCDSADRETFEALRVGASFGSWQWSVRSFLAEANAARARGARPPMLTMFTVLNGDGLEATEATISFARELGFRAMVLFEPIPPSADRICRNRPLVDRVRLARAGRRVGIGVSVCARRGRIPPAAPVRCVQPWDYVFIRANGDVAPCRALVDPAEAPVMGNLLEQSFMEIWHGVRFRAFRKASALGTNPVCLHCPYY